MTEQPEEIYSTMCPWVLLQVFMENIRVLISFKIKITRLRSVQQLERQASLLSAIICLLLPWESLMQIPGVVCWGTDTVLCNIHDSTETQGKYGTIQDLARGCHKTMTQSRSSYLRQTELARLSSSSYLRQTELARLSSSSYLRQTELARLSSSSYLRQTELARLRSSSYLRHTELTRLSSSSYFRHTELTRLSSSSYLRHKEFARLRSSSSAYKHFLLIPLDNLFIAPIKMFEKYIYHLKIKTK